MYYKSVLEVDLLKEDFLNLIFTILCYQGDGLLLTVVYVTITICVNKSFAIVL